MVFRVFATSQELAVSINARTHDVTLIGVGATVFYSGEALVMNDSPSNSFQSVLIMGTLAGGTRGVLMGTVAFPLSQSSVTVGENGAIFGAYGIETHTHGSQIVNQGIIQGYNDAISIGESSSNTNDRGITIINSGLITSSVTDAITRESDSAGIVILRNSGDIVGAEGFDSYNGNSVPLSTDRLFNSGRFVGDINLGGGDDLYDGRGGTVNGWVAGEAGNDTFIAGTESDTFYGGFGIDALDFRSLRGSGVEVYLDLAEDNTATAQGDEYSGIEILLGTRRFADVLQGDGANNGLRGFGGADWLLGQSGGDRIEGGNGLDTIYGGAGNDQYVFYRSSEAGDNIRDFSSSAAGNNDQFFVRAAGFGLTLVTGRIIDSGNLILRADNIAQQVDDIFVLRTSDQTLWVDRDGNGAAAPVLLADLQTGATVAFTDIWIY